MIFQRAAVIVLCFGVALIVRATVAAPAGFWLTLGAESLAVWFAYVALVATPDPRRVRVLRLWGLDWTRDEACCHFFVTGATGTGKTARAIVPIVHGLRRALPTTGIMAIDSKGALWKPLAEIARALGHEDSLRLIRVRPEHIPVKDWKAPLRLNLLSDRSVPWTTYAKIIVDTASASGQRGGQSFFKESARDVITHAMQALEIAGYLVSLDNVHNVICNSADTLSLVERLEKSERSDAAEEVQFFKDFAAQPPEQRSGTVGTVANYLRPYTPPDIAEVFCAPKPNFALDEIDLGRLICLSVPQTYQVERKYLNFLCKQLLFLHAFRRFDLDPGERQRRNMIVLILDEGQKTTLVSEDGFSDHGTVDELREAGMCVISATQTPLSFYASFANEQKADVFMANLRTQIHFRAADEKGATILAAKLGGREMRKYSGGVSGGRTSRSWQLVDEAWFKPLRLLALPAGMAVIKHPRIIGRPLLRRLPFTAFTCNEPRGAEASAHGRVSRNGAREP
jgi:type IV secretory pathway TraG/TraD family ATPase VirD4